MDTYGNGITVELPCHGRYSAQKVAFVDALRLGKRRLAREIARAHEGHGGMYGGMKRDGTVSYWLTYPVAILAVVWCDCYHSHDKGDDCEFCRLGVAR